MLASKLPRKFAQPASIDSFHLPFLYNTRTITRAYSDASDVAFDPADTSAKAGEIKEEDFSRPRTGRAGRLARQEGTEGYQGKQNLSYARGAAASFSYARDAAASPGRSEDTLRRSRTGERSTTIRRRRETAELQPDVAMEKSSRTAGRSERPGDSTMTWNELARFEKLFRMGVSGTIKPSQPEAKAKASQGRGRSVDYPKPEFPDLLRPLAEEAALMRDQANVGSKRLGDLAGISIASNERTTAYLAKVKDQMDNAKFDTELWQVLQDQVFNKIKTLGLRDDAGVDARLQAAMTTEKMRDFELLIETLPAIVLHYMRSIQTSFPGSSLGLVLLPNLKKLGSFAFTLGATTELFNQHMQLLYQQYTDLDGICNMLAEMDKEVYDFNTGTQKLLSSIFRHANACKHGQNGAALQALWLTDRKARALAKLAKWKDVVDERLTSAAMKAAREKTAHLEANDLRLVE